MINIVMDTNIIVSAALSPTGNPAKIIARISNDEEIQFFYSTQIFNEYRRVLAYERLNISLEKQNALIKAIKKLGIKTDPPTSTIPMPDETDRTFYDTAKASGAMLVTGNIKHYPAEPFIITPVEFLDQY